MDRRWVGLALGAAMMLAGCESRLETTKSLLGPGDGSGPQLRTGLWRIEDSGCSLRETNPVSDWPNCGQWLLVRTSDLATMTKEADGPVWTRKAYVLAGQDAQAMQVSEDASGQNFSLFGVRALSFAPDGRAVRIRRWVISCGVKRPTGRKDDDGRPEMATAPWPGATMDGEWRCHPDDAAGLLTAVAASETGEESPDAVWHWVRDGLEPRTGSAAAGSPPPPQPAQSTIDE
jgi:hypothetical protein